MLAALGAFWLAGCASGQIISLQSTPSGAVVYVAAAGAPNKRIKIGPTPARYSAPHSDEPVTLVFELEGFLPKEVVVAAPYRGKASVSVQLNTFSREWFREMLKTELAGEVNFVMEEIYSLPNMLASKNDAEAERLLNRATEKYGRFALFHSEAGTFYYSRKKYAKAKFHFLEVLRLTPDDVEAKNMLRVIDKL